MNRSAYQRAVALFEKLTDASLCGVHTSPSAIAKATGIPRSTAFRSIAALEAEGFLRRDENGIYLPGQSAMRTGLVAQCAGEIAPIAQAILVQLRQSTQHTAFLATYSDLVLAIGPHSIGRESRQSTISRRYQFEGFPDLEPGKIVETSIRPTDEDVVRRVGALIAPLSVNTSTMLVIGIFLNPTWGAAPHLETALEEASSRITRAMPDA